MKIYFMRHGQTTYNLLGLCNDDPAGPATLTDLGRTQAARAADELKDVPLERIYVSELPRTRQTADIVNRHHRVPIVTHPKLNDIRSGFNDRPVTEYFAATAHDPLRARINGGESLLDHRARVLEFLEWLKLQKEKTVLVVAHEESLRVFVQFVEKFGDENLREHHFDNGQIVSTEL
jgi:probable phosphoglycerate mutase